ncbi:MAG TPA: phospholipase C, phosphocholine-specific [Cyclobacteriaceae bacterium]|nr:phospholipase C, phosphocholine-specific [Cyclobacteriaceae bacterium]
MESRREFIKKAALLSGVGGLATFLPTSIARAFAINPQAGTTFLDAEHVVILMQENRSFDHCFGTLNGVRGFNDPRAVTLPDKKPVWLQTNENGNTYSPFRLNIKESNATWMGSLPHNWTDQVDVRNGGRCDQWLIAKRPGRKEYKDMPLTLGYYNREDIPFYYSLADAFTVCDQNFCSSLTGTTANRLHLWTGKIREDVKSPARVRNEETRYEAEAQWKTFPERLEENGISWKIYQNEISVGNEFDGEEDDWLANFTDNPIEWFSQYKVRFHPGYIKSIPKKIELLKARIKVDDEKLRSLQAGSEEHTQLKGKLDREKKELEITMNDAKIYTIENWNKLPQREKDIHQKAFTTNANDPDYHRLVSVSYDDNGTAREMKVPKGDVLHQFRKDVNEGKLPAVSWLVAPSNFSDHPGSPWYGAWYLSESMDILTKNPEVWKKTIFILCYDENDGYFDHVPPFIPPVAGKPETGSVSKGIDTSTEHLAMEMDLKRKPSNQARGGAIGLGYRVPLVIASPWSRGGAVNSQVFDHTSILMFLEKFLSHKTGKKIEEPNISSWRRAVCGDMTSVFKPYNGETMKMPESVKKNEFYENIHKAQFKHLPVMPAALTNDEIARINSGKTIAGKMPSQEKGTRPSNALPYELHVSGTLNADGTSFKLTFEARKEIFKDKAAGAPFTVYAYGKEWATRNYAVNPGQSVSDSWPLNIFENREYHFRVDGPNGFMREFKGNGASGVLIDLGYESDKKKNPTGNVMVNIVSAASQPDAEIIDNAYGRKKQTAAIGMNTMLSLTVDTSKSYGWYDYTVRTGPTEVRFAGRIETGKESITDPAIDRPSSS